MLTANPEKFIEVLVKGMMEQHGTFSPVIAVFLNAPKVNARCIFPPELDHQFFGRILYTLFFPRSIDLILNYHWREICQLFPNNRLPLTAEGFNARGINDAPSAFLYLCSCPAGIQLLTQHWDTFFPLFTQEGFRQIFNGGPHKGQSVTSLFFSNAHNYPLLDEHWEQIYPLLSKEEMHRKAILTNNYPNLESAADLLRMIDEKGVFYRKHRSDLNALGIDFDPKAPDVVPYTYSPLTPRSEPHHTPSPEHESPNMTH